MIESIIKIDEANSGEAQKEVMNQYKNTPGVWVLVGREKQSGAPWECLQVGQSKTIGREILADISRLRARSLPPIEKEYVNQFGESQFQYLKYPDRADQLYSHIAECYTDLEFKCVVQGEELDNRILRKCEKYVAYQTSCRYWVNGRQFSKAKDRQEIDSIKGLCKEECAKLYKQIESSIGSKKAAAMKKFVEDLADGKINA